MTVFENIQCWKELMVGTEDIELLCNPLNYDREGGTNNNKRVHGT